MALKQNFRAFNHSSNSEQQTAVCTFHTAVWAHVSAELKVMTTDVHCIQTVAVGVYAGSIRR